MGRRSWTFRLKKRATRTTEVAKVKTRKKKSSGLSASDGAQFMGEKFREPVGDKGCFTLTICLSRNLYVSRRRRKRKSRFAPFDCLLPAMAGQRPLSRLFFGGLYVLLFLGVSSFGPVPSPGRSSPHLPPGVPLFRAFSSLSSLLKREKRPSYIFPRGSRRIQE